MPDIRPNAMRLALPIIKKWEGLGPEWHKSQKIVAYLCPAGKWTLGYGDTRTIDPITGKERAVKQGDTLPDEPAALARLIPRVAGFMDHILTKVKHNLAPFQLAALTSFAYNNGLGAFDASTLLKVINLHQLDQVPVQLRRWTKATSPKTGKLVELKGLKDRREDEVALFCGKLPS